jgi:hypothetical protein
VKESEDAEGMLGIRDGVEYPFLFASIVSLIATRQFPPSTIGDKYAPFSLMVFFLLR